MTRQRPNETFTSFLARWKAKAAQVIDLPPEKEEVRIMISSYLFIYIYYRRIDSFPRGTKAIRESVAF